MKKQSNGMYRTKIVIGHDPNGKPINKWISAKTKKELEQKRQLIIDRYINGNRALENITFGTYIKRWFEVKKEPFIAQGTRNLYRSIINARLLPEFRDRYMHTITSSDIQEYINTLSNLSESRVSSIRNILVSVFGSAISDGIITINPATHLNIIARPKKEKYVLTPEDRKRIESVCRSHTDGLLLALLYYTGMRDGELCALKWSNIDIPDHVIHITGSLKHDDGVYVGSTKTASSVRDVPIPLPLNDLLTAADPNDQEQFVISQRGNKHAPIRAYELRIRWSRLMEACQLGEHENVSRNIHFRASITPHALRHNFTTVLYESGIDPYTASKLLGHSSIQTTMNIYAHFTEQAKETALANLNSIFKVAQS